MIRLFLKKSFTKDFKLIFFVLAAIIVSENAIALPQWNRNLVNMTYHPGENSLNICIGLYDYSFLPNSKHGYLANCKFEASVNNVDYFTLMEIQSPRQKKLDASKINFKKKLDRASLIFLVDPNVPKNNIVWPNHLSEQMQISIPNNGDLCIAELKWKLGDEFKNVRYIRITGRWVIADISVQLFNDIVYDIQKPTQLASKSNIPDRNTNQIEKKTVNIFKNHEAVVIKGTDLGSNIKVYSTSGLEIKSVISDDNVVKINRPPKQIYIVHIGNSQHKVYL